MIVLMWDTWSSQIHKNNVEWWLPGNKGEGSWDFFVAYECRTSVLRGEKSSGNGLHRNVNVLNTIELCA